MSRIVEYDELGHGLCRRPAPTRQRRMESDPGRTGLPHCIGISDANLHGSQVLLPLVRGIPPIRSRRGPRRRWPAKLHADKGYDCDHLRRCLRQPGTA
jgi:hypothetical protein